MIFFLKKFVRNFFSMNYFQSTFLHKLNQPKMTFECETLLNIENKASLSVSF